MSETPTPSTEPETMLLAPLACRRCHERKRKCDRRLPRCSKCADADVACEAMQVVSKKQMSQAHEQAMREAEDARQRVQWLEAFVRQAHPELQNIGELPTGADMSRVPAPRQAGASSYLTLVTSGLVMGEREQCTGASLDALPPIEVARASINTYLSDHKQSHHYLALDDLERDLQVYSEGRLMSPDLAHSRFRLFGVVYITYLLKRGSEQLNDTDRARAQLCRGLMMREMEKVVAQEDLAAVQALMLLASIAMHGPGRLSIWQLLGLATRTAIAIQLHRKDATVDMNNAASRAAEEKRRNTFWALYSLDRLVGFTLSQPFALPDRIIEIELPSVPICPAPGGELDHSVALRHHQIQLRRLCGRITDSLYLCGSLPQQCEVAAYALITEFRKELLVWYTSSPLKRVFIPISERTISKQVTDDLAYQLCMMSLHRPSRLLPTISSEFVIILRNAATTTLDLYRQYWAQNQVLIAWTHVSQLVSTCVTLMYCLAECNSRSDLKPLSATDIDAHIGQCRFLLTRFAPHWPDSARYKAMFEAIAVPLQANALSDARGQPEQSHIPEVYIPEPFEPIIEDPVIPGPDLTAGHQGPYSPLAVMQGLWDDVAAGVFSQEDSAARIEQDELWFLYDDTL